MKKKLTSAIGLLLLCASVFSQPKIKLDTFALNISKPVVVTNDGNTSKMYIVSQDGFIMVLDSLGTKLDTFLNISSEVIVSSEQGLLGLTFHPDYKNNGYFYVNYTRKTDGATRISRFKVSSNPNKAIADSELIILGFAQPFANHNGGDVHFGNDGYLYIGTGDGGFAGDPNNNAQNKNSYLGKILRIDVNSGSPYAIPPSNPFYSQSNVKKEIWAFGLRNPWRYTFDHLTHNLWIADVGQDKKEEVNFQKASSPGGENYGWRCYEADTAYNTSGCAGYSSYVAPVFSYRHNATTGGYAIIGGVVYRGNKYNDLKGIYMFTDYSTGNFWITQNQGDTVFTTTKLTKILTGISSFGEDIYNEVYLTDVDNKNIYKLRELCSPFTASITGSANPCFPVNNGSITLNVTNPNGSPSIKWSNGDSATTHPVNLAAGKYIVTIKDAIGCVRKDSVVLTVDSISKPVIQQNGAVLSTDAGFTYKWFLNTVELTGRTSDTLQAGTTGNYQVQITNGQGCQAISNNYSYVASGIALHKNEFDLFSIAPNPAHDAFRLEIAAKNADIKSYRVCCMDGKIILEKIVGKKQLSETISVNDLPKGMYLLTVVLENGNEISEKVAVE